jgi:hypothetical protein
MKTLVTRKLVLESGSKTMKSEDDIALPIARKDQGKAETARFVHSDHIGGVLGDFSDLTKAVRQGDLATVSALCTQLFDLNFASKVRPQPTPIAP